VISAPQRKLSKREFRGYTICKSVFPQILHHQAASAMANRLLARY